MMLYLTVIIFQDNSVWENALSERLDARASKGEVIVAAACFQLRWQKRNVFIERERGMKTRC